VKTAPDARRSCAGRRTIFRQTFPGFSGIYARRIADVVAPHFAMANWGHAFLAFGRVALPSRRWGL